MNAFPAILYRSPGIYTKPGGGTYKILGVADQAAQDAHLSTGWFLTSLEAIEAAGDDAYQRVKARGKWAVKAVKNKQPGKPLVTPDQAVEEPLNNASPTREELETKGAQLGVKFDGRTSNNKLSQLIAARLLDNIEAGY